jgi:hypothetical protein
LGIVADIIPHLEEVSSFILTSTVKAVPMQPLMGLESFWMSNIGSSNV